MIGTFRWTVTDINSVSMGEMKNAKSGKGAREKVVKLRIC